MCPSNQDNVETLRQAAMGLMNSSAFNNDKKDACRVKMNQTASKDPPRSHDKMRFPCSGAEREIGDIWVTFQNACWSKDYVSAMESIPRMAELEKAKSNNGKDMTTCTFGPTLKELRGAFDEIWQKEMERAESQAYRNALPANRKFGVTKFASGLRVWEDPADDASGFECVVDWALVENTGVKGTNAIPEVSRPRRCSYVRATFCLLK